ncbi:TlpA family protein disulfide reductase [Fuchsiella alkaliacetigena]|uniref:TlpA family protein disulfide reductase n=1 Tax=Fuchsiella alkaliacetigena TaxID=957042 RepID=UPI00200B90C1|nr:TlpA disulfide reductase family protein [Fuchsiella alkaliacetigena]MCK8824520.1 TlpA family protein disulfide reductase [Fuchsiella alkaliacetigena]
MKKKKFLVVIIMVIAVLVTIIACDNQEVEEETTNSTQEFENNEEVEVDSEDVFKERAPDFTLIDLEGNEVTLSAYQGDKVVFLNFWASWCPPCRNEMSAMQRIYEQRQEEVKILAVNVRENKQKVRDFIEKEGYQFSILLDQKGEVASTYLVRGIPKTLIIDEKGLIRSEHIGALNKDQMNKLIDEALK